MKTCSSKNLLHIATALDCFYEIFSEAFYDQILNEQGVIPLMLAGEPTLREMYKLSKKAKQFAPHELAEIENALENVLPFI